MPPDDPQTPTSPTRRRGAALEHAIISAAAEELMTAGYAGFNMDRVARRARTNKTALYRRWPNRAALAIAAYHHLARTQYTPPDTGNLRDDALAVLRQANQHWASPLGAVLRGLLAGAPDDPDLLRQLQARAAEGGADMFAPVLERAVARGEARPEALNPRVASVAVALLRHEYLTRGTAEVSDSALVEIVDEVYMPLVRAVGSKRP